jgi:hypothetical protein
LIEEGSGKSTVDTLRRFLSGRWDADAKYLNLEAIADDAILQDAGIEQPDAEDKSKVGAALMKLAGEMFPDVSDSRLQASVFFVYQANPSVTSLLPSLSLEIKSLRSSHIHY